MGRASDTEQTGIEHTISNILWLLSAIDFVASKPAYGYLIKLYNKGDREAGPVVLQRDFSSLYSN